MGLKQDIVLVNEFSIKRADGTGSRGATPGSYVERYMARDLATESLAPVRRRETDDFIYRYMARSSAVEHAPSIPTAKATMREAQGKGGVAFGYGSVSLSDQQLRAASANIQHFFDAGHTVMKTVLSFDADYLKRMGIVAQDFTLEQAGDYRGQIDQMKLRMAIMHGLDRMSAGTSGFEDLRYVGVIQVDTEHVHAHLAMVDASMGSLRADGTQRGKLLDRHKSRLRRGVDAWLDEKQAVAHLSSAVGYERRNVTMFIKRWAHTKMLDETLPQFLVACLPEDRTLWRAGSHDPRMRKANEIVTAIVTEQLERPGSPMPVAMARVTEYANSRQAREHLRPHEWQQLIDDGRDRIMERAVNGVYQMVRALPEDALRIRTPMLDVMSLDYEQVAKRAQEQSQGGKSSEQDLVMFAFRLRSYASRLEHHRTQARKYRDLRQSWIAADKAGVAASDSKPLAAFYDFESEYQLQLVAKYEHFLPQFNDTTDWYAQQREVSEYGDRLLSLIALRGDGSLQRMKDPDEAEGMGREIYGQPGGGLLTEGAKGRLVLDQRISQMRARHAEQVSTLSRELIGSGLVLRVEPSAKSSGVRLERGTGYDFADVKALDLHRLGYDFFTDVEVGPKSRQTFVSTAQQRRHLLIGAMTYLEKSNQEFAIADLPVDDVSMMVRTARSLTASADARGVAILPSRFADLRRQHEDARQHATVSMDAGLAGQLRAEIDRMALVAGTERDFDRDPTATQGSMELL